MEIREETALPGNDAKAKSGYELFRCFLEAFKM